IQKANDLADRDSRSETKVASNGFLEDLEREFAQGIKMQIDRRFQPEYLTNKLFEL
ncbi:MAG: hypothetical protein RLZZ135_438, partial [Cyanobacteriota bacterium]